MEFGGDWSKPGAGEVARSAGCTADEGGSGRVAGADSDLSLDVLV
jgi:hypothetical protein